MNIGIDLDQTLINHLVPVEEQAAKNLGIKEYPEVNDWYFSSLTQEHKAEIMRLFDDPYFMGINGNEPIPGTQEKLYNWSLMGHKIVIITARNKPIREETEHLVDEFFPVVKKIRFTEIDQPKKDIMLEEKIDIWIDDNPKDIQTSCALGIETYLIYNDITKRYIPKEIIETLPVIVVNSVSDIKSKGEI